MDETPLGSCTICKNDEVKKRTIMVSTSSRIYQKTTQENTTKESMHNYT